RGDARRAGMHHQLRPVEKPSYVDPDQRRWDHSEVREHRIAAADAPHTEKHLAEAVLFGDLLEWRGGIGNSDEVAARMPADNDPVHAFEELRELDDGIRRSC